MGRKKVETRPGDEPMGIVLAGNLARLGYAESFIKTTEVAKLVTDKTGHKMSRQRVANLLNAVRITPATIEIIAKGLGVSPKELMKPLKR